MLAYGLWGGVVTVAVMAALAMLEGNPFRSPKVFLIDILISVVMAIIVVARLSAQYGPPTITLM
jgi:multidrug transporter EmrE-like cation transporter